MAHPQQQPTPEGMNPPDERGEVDLRDIARQAMLHRGFLVQFSRDAQREAAAEQEPNYAAQSLRDLTSWLWSSIDNDDSRDLDQIEYAVQEPVGVRLYIAIADVDWFVARGSALDLDAKHNTTSVYTGVVTFPMLPERLSTDLSSLNENVHRLAMVVEMLVNEDGSVSESAAYPAIVKNQAQLTYRAVAAWLEGNTDTSRPQFSESVGAKTTTAATTTRTVLQRIAQSLELRNQLRLQVEVAEKLRQRRHEAGALTLETTELEPVLSTDGRVLDLDTHKPNRASLLIEDFMIAANQVVASLLEQKRVPSIQRVVKTPAHWDRIVALAGTLGKKLPATPDAASLEAFLKEQREVKPEHFHDLSLSIVKLLGRGEYVLKEPGSLPTGHFGLAVHHYLHSTAPNRRYPDLLSQRLLKAALAGTATPYSVLDLKGLAATCTQREDDANKVERFVKKCAAATLLRFRIGEKFTGIVTGASEKGTWVRVSNPPVEGRLQGAIHSLQVGDPVEVRLHTTDPFRGFIDFVLV